MKTIRNVALPALGVLIALIHLAPIYIALTVALKRTGDFSSRWALPDYFTLHNFGVALTQGALPRAFLNSLLLTAVTTLVIVAVGAMAGYPLARIRSGASRLLLGVVLAVMMVPSLSVIVPLYTVMNDMNGVNTHWGMILALAAYNAPLGIFLYANFMRTIPRELDEAAIVDGCSGFSVFYRIILPLLKPVTVSVVILKGLKTWNDYEFALYFQQKPEKHTITLAISRFFSEFSSDLHAASAAALLAVVPVVAAFLALQKYFIAGLSEGAVK